MPRPLLVALPLLCALCCALLGAPQALAQAADRPGIVMLHGKNAGPADKSIHETVRLLQNVGLLVAAPELPWSKRRGFDATYEQSLVEIGLAVAELRARGATRVALAGHGLGANASLAYIASRGGIFALVALAPAHDPDRHRDVFIADVRKAREMRASGRGAERSLFTDYSLGRDYDLSTSAEIYLSYNDPEGAAVMPRAAERVAERQKEPLPVLWVVGAYDPLSRLGRFYAFEKLPRHPRSDYVEVQADHLGVPRVAAPQVVEWLRALVQNPEK